ncbi:unannotated protein [freshwater metagenome]|uniref:Unannotated protein n=1 Tax=freshwater metagenome TaxID=449393 RepID=A0A6J7CIT9_9ZZZZ|nr:sulfur carrier protein ThiS [Actinomycetota bacterium]MUH57605.1 sulfur carrier protein ThiS [Actinomycetota bacterium]
MIEVEFNGSSVSSLATSVADFVEERSLPRVGVAVAINGSVIPRSEWAVTALLHADVIEIVTAAAGG